MNKTQQSLRKSPKNKRQSRRKSPKNKRQSRRKSPKNKKQSRRKSRRRSKNDGGFWSWLLGRNRNIIHPEPNESIISENRESLNFPVSDYIRRPVPYVSDYIRRPVPYVSDYENERSIISSDTTLDNPSIIPNQ